MQLFFFSTFFIKLFAACAFNHNKLPFSDNKQHVHNTFYFLWQRMVPRTMSCCAWNAPNGCFAPYDGYRFLACVGVLLSNFILGASPGAYDLVSASSPAFCLRFCCPRRLSRRGRLVAVAGRRQRPSPAHSAPPPGPGRGARGRATGWERRPRPFLGQRGKGRGGQRVARI
jgi:hypothetical protein